MMYTAGFGTPPAIAISSTTLSSILCSGSFRSTGTAWVDSSTALSPPASAHQAENPPEAHRPEGRDRDPRSHPRSVEKRVRAHPEERQEEDEADEDHSCSRDVPLLLVVQVGVMQVSVRGVRC